jgi:hypothetical protein
MSVRTTQSANVPPAVPGAMFLSKTAATEYDGTLLGTLAFLVPITNRPQVSNFGAMLPAESGLATK